MTLGIILGTQATHHGGSLMRSLYEYAHMWHRAGCLRSWSMQSNYMTNQARLMCAWRVILHLMPSSGSNEMDEKSDFRMQRRASIFSISSSYSSATTSCHPTCQSVDEERLMKISWFNEKSFSIPRSTSSAQPGWCVFPGDKWDSKHHDRLSYEQQDRHTLPLHGVLGCFYTLIWLSEMLFGVT